MDSLENLWNKLWNWLWDFCHFQMKWQEFQPRSSSQMNWQNIHHWLDATGSYRKNMVPFSECGYFQVLWLVFWVASLTGHESPCISFSYLPYSVPSIWSGLETYTQYSYTGIFSEKSRSIYYGTIQYSTAIKNGDAALVFQYTILCKFHC